MAAIDKIYGTLEQEKEFRSWVQENKPAILKNFYPWADEWLTDGKEHPITNFPVEVDRWLYGNCPIPWVLERLTEQYRDKRP